MKESISPVIESRGLPNTQLTTLLVGAEKSGFTSIIPAIQSLLLWFFLFFPLTFMELILHEGGHALDHVLEGGIITVFYVHPFAFNGYVRPILFWNNPWSHLAGPGVAILAAFLISYPFWKRRSKTNLPLAMLWPMLWTSHGINMITQMIFRSGDFNNIVTITGLPREVFTGLGILLACAGLLVLFAILPLFGLAPKDKKTLIVVPGALALFTASSIPVAHLFVPGSRIDVLYRMGPEIITSADSAPLFAAIFGVLIALLYITLYRFVYRRLPAGLRSEKRELSWSDLRFPALLFTVSVVIGLIAIR